MYLCEAEAIIPRPNQLYRFVVNEDCVRCKELAAIYDNNLNKEKHEQ